MLASRQFRKIGSLWGRLTRSGDVMFSGEIAIDGAIVGVVIHVNKHKKRGSNQPDFFVYAAEDELTEAEDALALFDDPF